MRYMDGVALAHGYWVIDVDELWDVALNKVPELVSELRPPSNRIESSGGPYDTVLTAA